MAYYLNLFSPETLNAFNQSPRNISGFRKQHVRVADKIRPGDKLVCYVTKFSRWVGVLEVKSKKFIDNKPIFSKKDDPFVVRFKVKPLVWLDIENAIPIHENVVWENLSFTKGQKRGSHEWTGKFRGSLAQLDKKDGDFLMNLLKKQKKRKIIYKFDQRQVTSRDIGNILHDKIERLFGRMGFAILRSDYNKPGPDIVVNDPEILNNTKILIQCKRNTGEKRTYPSIDDLIFEYAGRVKEEKASLAILVLSGYSIAHIDSEVLRRNKVIIWTDDLILNYEKLTNMVGRFAKYQLFSDCEMNYAFGEEKSFDSFKVIQNRSRIVFYVFKANPEWLLRSASVLRRIDWGPNIKGYQRILEKSRLNRISRFFERDDWSLPGTLIFSTNSKIEDLTVNLRHGKLKLPSKIGSLWVMDGQHRLYSFAKADENLQKNTELICVVFDSSLLGENAEEKQANIFVDINMNVKKVNTALLLELLREFRLLGPGTKGERVALDVVSELSKMRVFKGLISVYSRKGGSISLTTFVKNSAMQRIISVKGLLKEKDENKIKKACAKELKTYFKLVSRIFEDEWGNDDFALSTDKGIRGLLKLFTFITENKFGDGLEDYSKKILKVLKESDFDFRIGNFKNQYAGEGGANRLVDEWTSKIKNGVPAFRPDFNPQNLNLDKIKIPNEEDKYNEFKGSLRWDIENQVINKDLAVPVLKAISAFLNSDGGRLFIGIHDAGNILGLNNDYKSLNGGRDKFRLHLTNLIRQHLGESVIQYIQIKFNSKEDRDYCVVEVDKSSYPVFMDRKEFYQRAFASSVPLEGEERQKYISQHWPNS